MVQNHILHEHPLIVTMQESISDYVRWQRKWMMPSCYSSHSFLLSPCIFLFHFLVYQLWHKLHIYKTSFGPIFLRNSKNNVHNRLCHDAEIFLCSHGAGSVWLAMLTLSLLLAVGPSGGLHPSGKWSGVTCSIWRIHVKLVFPSLQKKKMLVNFGMDLPFSKKNVITTKHDVIKPETELELPFTKSAKKTGWRIAENICSTKIDTPSASQAANPWCPMVRERGSLP